jgi:twitching motility protein PilU
MKSLEVILNTMVDNHASDLYITYGIEPMFRIENDMQKASDDVLNDEAISEYLSQLLNEEQLDEFYATFEFNSAINWHDKARFRINVFKQQQHYGMVIRRIHTEIPSLDSLGLLPCYKDLIMAHRGLILIVGPTGSGKSTSLAAMIGHRNSNSKGHIITVEDPIEFVHSHKGCIVTQRDIGIDTYSFGMALKSAVRQRPDVVVIGEIRDRETIEQALLFAETGHLCVATLHSSNTYQAVERILSLFPQEKHKQILMTLALNLRGILSQRLVCAQDDSRVLAIEVMLNEGLITSHIEEGKIKEIKEIMERNRNLGMQSFDQSLIDLVENNKITAEVAYAEADSIANIKLHLRQKVTNERVRAATSSLDPDNDF